MFSLLEAAAEFSVCLSELDGHSSAEQTLSVDPRPERVAFPV